MGLDFTTMNQDDAEELGVLGEWHAARRDPAVIARKRARWECAGKRSRDDGRVGGSIASVLDADALLTAGRELYAEQHPGADVAAAVTHGPLPQMTFTADGDRMAVVNGEGVGGVSADGATVPVWFAVDGMWDTLELPAAAVAQATTLDVIDLADGIRHFGHRLDANHRGWRARYTS